MKSEVAIIFFLFATVLEAIPRDYNYETCPRFSEDENDYTPVVIQNRIGMKRGLKGHSKLSSKPSEGVESNDYDDELNSLFKSFWAVDNLPRKSPFVSIKKLPDVYMDHDDQPSPISDLMPVERSELTEEAKDIRDPLFGEMQFYNTPLQVENNAGNKVYNNAMYRQQPNRNVPEYMGYHPYYYNATQTAPDTRRQNMPSHNIPPKKIVKPQVHEKKTNIQPITKKKVHETKLKNPKEVKLDSHALSKIAVETTKTEESTPGTSLEHIEIIPKKENLTKVKDEVTTTTEAVEQKPDDQKQSEKEKGKLDIKP